MPSGDRVPVLNIPRRIRYRLDGPVCYIVHCSQFRPHKHVYLPSHRRSLDAYRHHHRAWWWRGIFVRPVWRWRGISDDPAADLLRHTSRRGGLDEANQIVASSVSGVLAHMRRGNVDFKMGGILMAGGVIGSTLGVALFSSCVKSDRLISSSSFPTSFSWASSAH